LADVPPGRRAARFRCVIAVAAPDGAHQTAEGVCQGRILQAPRGTAGFGFDPVFEVPDLGRTFAELSPEEKNRISHRGRALRAALPLIERFLAGTK
jgi:XTP/dITP diphosphohydrolase